MKKLLFGIFALGIANLCNAQKIGENDEVKFNPPVIKKNKQASKTNKAVKFTPPLTKKDEEVKFTPPVIKKNKPNRKK